MATTSNASLGGERGGNQISTACGYLISTSERRQITKQKDDRKSVVLYRLQSLSGL